MRLVEHRGKWAARHEGRRISSGVRYAPETREDAERALRKKLQELAPNVGGEIGEIMEAYARDKESEGRDGDRCRASWRALKPVFDGLSPDDVTRGLCRSFADMRRDDNKADGTIIRDLKIMKAACSWHAPRNAGQFWYPPEPEPRDRWITKEELQRLIDVSPPHLQVFIHVLYGTAARAGAVYDLPWLNVRFDKNEIDLGRKKNGKRRAVVPMTKSLRAVLESAKESAETGHVIEYAGKRVKSCKKAFATACANAGLDDFHIHDIRHTAAVHGVAEGRPMQEISQYLGHSNIHVTSKIYARYAPEHLRGMADALEL